MVMAGRQNMRVVTAGSMFRSRGIVAGLSSPGCKQRRIGTYTVWFPRIGSFRPSLLYDSSRQQAYHLHRRGMFLPQGKNEAPASYGWS